MIDLHSAEVTNSAILAERLRAHALHGDKSMEADEWDASRRLRILLEEVGEVAKVLNDLDLGHLSAEQAQRDACKELIQVAAMAAAWAEACDRPAVPWTADEAELAAEMARHPAGKRR